MNPFCEIAVEEAVRLKEKGVATEIVAVSIGPTQAQETIRTALAMGADRGILIQTDADPEPLAVAKLLKAVVEAEKARPGPDGQAGHRRRQQRRRPDAGGPARTGRRRPSPPRSRSPAATAKVTREVDGGLQTLELDLPAVVTADLRLNEPRYASLPNIMKAKKKTDRHQDAGRLRRRHRAGHLKVLKVTEPPKRVAGVKVETAAELVAKLKTEAGVL